MRGSAGFDIWARCERVSAKPELNEAAGACDTLIGVMHTRRGLDLTYRCYLCAFLVQLLPLAYPRTFKFGLVAETCYCLSARSTEVLFRAELG